MEPVIIDAVIVCVLVGFTIYGARRGLFRSLAGLLSVVIALVGAGLFAKTLAGPMTNLLAPMLEGGIEQRVEEAASIQNMPEALPGTETLAQLNERVENLLELMGMDPENVRTLSEQTVEKLQETGRTIVSAVVDSLMQSILYGVLFILAFLALLLALKLLTRVFDLVLDLPILNGLNTLGGAVGGLVEAGLLVFLLVWAARRLGVSFETDFVAATYVLRFFTTNTPLSVLSFLL